ncbi:hypothetical protein CEXT_87141 [Caerostris extrusa]|uniref:Uncharacterized protein n=1 Tax=Caerostris extrusa TaxID=172846 RepID=A0AAV4T8C9_CAEEX|nr:hypothetical protein CEXT_87141 [Caerostris extrusa]
MDESFAGACVTRSSRVIRESGPDKTFSAPEYALGALICRPLCLLAELFPAMLIGAAHFSFLPFLTPFLVLVLVLSASELNGEGAFAIFLLGAKEMSSF